MTQGPRRFAANQEPDFVQRALVEHGVGDAVDEQSFAGGAVA